MARNLSSRILVRGILVAVCPVRVGGIHRDPEVDLSLAIDGRGRFYIPGTSLAGALRAWMAAAGDREIVCKIIDRFWGALENEQPNHASFILVEDAPIENAIPEVRDGVGIDRILGTAAERVKYNQAILPKGTRIPLDMTVELADGVAEEPIFMLLKDLLQSLEDKKLRLGASKTRGMGRVELQGLAIERQILNTAQGMVQALRQQSIGIELENLSNATPPKARSRLHLSVGWKPIGALTVKAESDGIAVDHLPLVGAIDADNLAFVLPGSSIKGSLRTQAERIVRTVKQRAIPDSNDPSHRFMQQLEQDSLVTALFGKAAKVRNNGDRKEQLGHIGALAVDDCYAKIPINVLVWHRIASAENSIQLYAELETSLPKTQQGFHVAIDRWTGGAADGLLYSTLEPTNVRWEPIALTLDLERLERNVANYETGSSEAAIALLLLVLRDLMAGRIPLGYGTNRGMGAIAIERIRFEDSSLPEELAALRGIKLQHTGDFQRLIDPEVMRSLQKAWTNWICPDLAILEVAS